MECNFYMPVHMIQGRGCVRQHPEVFKRMGKMAMIVTGHRSAKKNGSLKDVTETLLKAGIGYVVFDEIMSNPTIEIVYRGAGLMKEKGADFVIAIGGGSPMDAAKAIALLYSQKVREDMLFSGQYEDCLPPMVMIPTTAGTGSEVTQYAILTNDKAQTKTSIGSPYLFADVAFLDAQYMMGLGLENTIHTAVDALSHSIEGMISKRANVLTDVLAKDSIRQIAGCLWVLARGYEISLEAREKLLYASALGGMVIAHTGTTAVHSMGYGLTYFKNVDHGKANGLLLPEFLKLAMGKIPERIQEILDAMNMEQIEDFTKLMTQLLGEHKKLTREEIHTYTEIAVKAKNMTNAAFEMDRDQVIEIYQNALGR